MMPLRVVGALFAAEIATDAAPAMVMSDHSGHCQTSDSGDTGCAAYGCGLCAGCAMVPTITPTIGRAGLGGDSAAELPTAPARHYTSPPFRPPRV